MQSCPTAPKPAQIVRRYTEGSSWADQPMKKHPNKSNEDLRPEYDLRELFRNGVKGKYAKAYRAGTNLVPLDPDVKRVFPDEKAVNDALRLVIQLRKVGRVRA